MDAGHHLDASRPTSTVPKRPRRFLQISLRTLFVLLTIGCVWLGILTKRARDQRAAVNRVLELGGFAQYDYEWEAIRKRVRPVQPGWPWLRQWIGPEYFQDVVRVNLDDTAVTDDDLRLIGRLRALHTLSLNCTQISDDGLVHVRQCRKVRYLGLAETKVTSDGLSNIAEMHELEDLMLEGASVDDRAAKHIRHLRRLSLVTMGGTRVSSKGVEELSRLPALRWLDLSNSAVDDSALQHLLSMDQSMKVNLRGSQMSAEGLLDLRDARPNWEIEYNDADVSHRKYDDSEKAKRAWQSLVTRLKALSDEQRLQLIDLSSTQITDRHLADLHGLKSVQMIDLRDTQVTDAGVEAFQKALPDCKVRR